jgi:hypothetical protein
VTGRRYGSVVFGVVCGVRLGLFVVICCLCLVRFTIEKPFASYAVEFSFELFNASPEIIDGLIEFANQCVTFFDRPWKLLVMPLHCHASCEVLRARKKPAMQLLRGGLPLGR